MAISKSEGNLVSVASKSCSFSIEHILKVAGTTNSTSECCRLVTNDRDSQYDWLHCTRYKPPKLQRQKKRDTVQRRKLGRNPRIPFSTSQVAFLEAKFLRSPYLNSCEVTQLATYLQLPETRVKIWFQNRRARERREREPQTHLRQTNNTLQDDVPRDLTTRTLEETAHENKQPQVTSQLSMCRPTQPIMFYELKSQGISRNRE